MTTQQVRLVARLFTWVFIIHQFANPIHPLIQIMQDWPAMETASHKQNEATDICPFSLNCLCELALGEERG
jgi:hypothetical protein